jgi:hypothetical protein
MVSYPVMGIMFGIILLALYLGSLNVFPAWTIAFPIVGCVLLPWLYWSFMITKWRIWAFENVRNVHELKKKAIEGKLIWKDGSFWGKTEIKMPADRDKLKMLETKFNQADIYTDDFTVPVETIVIYAKNKIYVELGVAVVLFFDNSKLFIWRATCCSKCLHSFYRLEEAQQHCCANYY